MKKISFLLIIAMILLSGCVGEKKEVKTGDNISVDYTGSLLNGKVFDTSIEKVAIENNLSEPGREFMPLKFTVGKAPQLIKGFDEGVVGMKVGQTKKLTIPPEKAYGPRDPMNIQAIPIIQDMAIERVIPKDFDVPVREFERVLGSNHTQDEIIELPETNIYVKVRNISSSNASLSYTLKVGDEVWKKGAPWNETVLKADGKNITLKAKVNKNDTIQLQGAPWNTTVVGLDNVNITLRHNPIPETVIPGMFGNMKVSFNETSILMDQNPELAGETLIFNVTVLSIDK